MIWDDKVEPGTDKRYHRHHIHARFPIDNSPTGEIILHGDPNAILADGVSKSTITSGIIRDKSGFQLLSGIKIRVSTNRGTINDKQISVDPNGRISFVLKSDTVVGIAIIEARSLEGNAVGHCEIIFNPNN